MKTGSKALNSNPFLRTPARYHWCILEFTHESCKHTHLDKDLGTLREVSSIVCVFAHVKKSGLEMFVLKDEILTKWCGDTIVVWGQTYFQLRWS